MRMRWRRRWSPGCLCCGVAAGSARAQEPRGRDRRRLVGDLDRPALSHLTPNTMVGAHFFDTLVDRISSCA